MVNALDQSESRRDPTLLDKLTAGKASNPSAVLGLPEPKPAPAAVAASSPKPQVSVEKEPEWTSGWQSTLNPSFPDVSSVPPTTINPISSTGGSTMITATKPSKDKTSAAIVQGVDREDLPGKKLRLWKGASDETTKLTATPADSVTPASKFAEPSVDQGPVLNKLRNIEVDQERTVELQKKADREAAETKPMKTRELTAERYAGLSPEKKAAIDFNTLLVEAREKDLNTEYEASGDKDPEYQAAVRRIFGEGDGSEIVAPETLALLNKLNFVAPERGKGSDFDDFLGLKSAFRAKDLRTIEDATKGNVYARLNNLPGTATESKGLIEGMQKLQQAMAASEQMKQDMKTSLTYAVGQEATFFGGTGNDVKVDPGFGNEGVDLQFQEAFATIADKNNDGQMADILQRMEDYFEPNGLSDSFRQYVDTRTKQALERGVPLIPGTSGRSPEEFRELLGLDRKAGA